MFRKIISILKEKLSSPRFFLIVVLIFLFLATFFLFDKALFAGVALIALLTAVTFLILKKIGFKTKTIYALFLIALSIHLGAVLFFHYANFQPFSGGAGDYSEYDVLAQQISERLRQGNFSLRGIDYGHFYPVIIGYIYTLTLPKAFIGQMFNAWLVALLVIFVYLIAIEIGGSEKQSFLAGLIVSIYPSLLFFGSLLLKDALVALLCSIVLLLILKLLKAFSWKKFLILYIFLTALTHFRLYIAFAAVLTFIICWFLFSNLKIKKRLIYGVIFIFLMGFLPNYSGGQGAGQGYYGINFIKVFLNRNTITQYRELFSIPNPKISPITGYPVYNESSAPETSAPETSAPETSAPETSAPETSVSESSAPAAKPVTKRGRGSAVTVETGFENPFTFLRNSLISFIYASLGPFPWQLRFLRHLFTLPEIILWYFALFFAVKGIKKASLPRAFVLPIFSLLVLGSISIYLANFGITTRIRIPAFISIFCLAPFGINWASNNKIIKFFSKKLDFLTT